MRALAHPLEPVVQVGREGFSDAVVAEMSQALARHELIKIRYRAEREEKKAVLESVAARLDAELVGHVGHVATFYRPNPDPERRRIIVD